TEHPPVPVRSMIANLNVDMIGRNAPDSIAVVGQEYSSLGTTLRQVSARRSGLGLTVVGDLWPGEGFFFRSDQLNFARKEVPAVFFFAGTHADYHRPSDDVELIDADKAARVARLIFFTAATLAASADPPMWHPDKLAEVRRLTR
ncbi:MAG: M28 family peptidase, partial [Gemmatimonadaceae bacterium]